MIICFFYLKRLNNNNTIFFQLFMGIFAIFIVPKSKLINLHSRSVQPVPPVPRGEKPYSRPRSEFEYPTIVLTDQYLTVVPFGF